MGSPVLREGDEDVYNHNPLADGDQMDGPTAESRDNIRLANQTTQSKFLDRSRSRSLDAGDSVFINDGSGKPKVNP